jgi:hypothetical protein
MLEVDAVLQSCLVVCFEHNFVDEESAVCREFSDLRPSKPLHFGEGNT